MRVGEGEGLTVTLEQERACGCGRVGCDEVGHHTGAFVGDPDHVGQTSGGSRTRWFPYAMFVFVTVEVVSVGAAFVLSWRGLRFAALPLLALLALIFLVPVLAWLPT